MSVKRNGCYAEGRPPQVFLSFETQQEHRALPYSLLLDMEISSDSCLLKLVFSHYEVLVRGSRLEEIYESVREGGCAAIMPGKSVDRYSTTPKATAVVTAVRIKRLETS